MFLLFRKDSPPLNSFGYKEMETCRIVTILCCWRFLFVNVFPNVGWLCIQTSFSYCMGCQLACYWSSGYWQLDFYLWLLGSRMASIIGKVIWLKFIFTFFKNSLTTRMNMTNYNNFYYFKNIFKYSKISYSIS